MTDITYSREINAKLHVHLENGETFEATPQDLTKFGYVSRSKAHSMVYDRLLSIMQDAELFDSDNYRDISDLEIAPIYSLVTTILMYPHLINHEDNKATFARIAEIERILRESEIEDGTLDA